MKQLKQLKSKKTDIYRYGVETTTLSEKELRSTAHITAVITHEEID